jgi:hypothetical protein
MINENCMFECEWCHADLGSNPKAYDEHVAECPAAIAAYKGHDYIEATFDEHCEEEKSHLMHAALEEKYPELYNPPDEKEKRKSK